MSGLYHQKGSDFKTYKRRLEIGWNIGEDPVWNWISDGVSIFHHGDRRDDDAVFSEYPGFRGDCRFTAASKIEQLVTQAYVALGTTMATYCAQNMGAGKILRIRQGFKSATWMGFAYAVVTGIFVMFAGKYLTPLFLSENLGQIMGYVDIYLKCVGLFFIPLTVVNVYRNGIQGMGFGILPMMAGVAELIGRGVVAIGAAHYKSYVGVCLASPAAWVLAGGLLLVMYFHIMKRYTEDLSGQK